MYFIYLFLTAISAMVHNTAEAQNDRIVSLPGLTSKINFLQYAGFINVFFFL
jgi:hypothetical protein